MSYLRQGSYQPGTTTNFTTSGTSQVTATVGNTTSIVRVSCTKAIYVEIGSAPTATTGSLMIPDSGTEFFAVEPGIDKVAVLQVSAAGVASITELATLS
jgi:hypothetical protein